MENNTIHTNERIIQQILKPENCHCTYRTLNDDSNNIGGKSLKTATAYCSSTHTPKAYINWFHGANASKIVFHLPIGERFERIIPKSDGLEAIDAAILAMFLKMDTAWHEAGDDEHTHTDHS